MYTGGTGPWSVQHTDPEIQQVCGPAGQGPAQEQRPADAQGEGGGHEAEGESV